MSFLMSVSLLFSTLLPRSCTYARGIIVIPVNRKHRRCDIDVGVFVVDVVEDTGMVNRDSSTSCS